jgi:hypothetical protein
MNLGLPRPEANASILNPSGRRIPSIEEKASLEEVRNRSPMATLAKNGLITFMQ